MEKHDHKKQTPNTPIIHPTLAVYLSGNFNDQPINSSQTSSSSVEPQIPTRSVYWDKLNKSKLQSSSVIGGYLQLLVSGFHIAWGIWRVDFNETWFQSVNGVFLFVMLSFYVGAMIGGILSGCIMNLWRKQAIYYLSGSIMVISSLILIISSSEQTGILFGRLIAGFGHGLVYNVIIRHAGENSMKNVRGIITSNINCFLWFSVFIGCLLIATAQVCAFSTRINSDRIIGMFGLVFSVFALTYTMFLTEESVVFLLNRSKLGEALELLSKLRNEPETSSNISEEFEELRLMVNRDKLENQNIFVNNNGKPLALMVALKLLHVFTNNFLFNWIFMMNTSKILTISNRRMAPVILTAVRFIGSVLQTFLGDSFGRKTFLNTSCALSGLTVLIFEIILITDVGFDGINALLCIIFQFFVALGVDPMHNVVLSESFSTSKKNWSIVFVNMCENSAQMFCIGICFVDGIAIEIKYLLALFISVTVFMFLMMFIVIRFLPETRGLSLSESSDIFRKITGWHRR